MLQMKHITITHRRDMRIMINDFSMVLNEGDKAAIIGEEGNGKSTLLKLIYDEALVEAYADVSGEIIKNGLRIGYLAQELDEAQKDRTVYEFLSECEAFYLLTPKELSDIAGELSIEMEFFYADRKVGQLSGGEKVKLQLARILMERPDLLCLDEPSNDIDIQTLEWLESFIRKTNLPVLYISHDELLLEHTANKIIHLEQIRRKTEARYTIAAAGYREYVQNRQKSLSRQEQEARNERSEYKKQQERFRQIQQKVEYQQNAISRQNPHGGRLLKKKMHAVKALEHRFEKEFEQMTEMPETEDAIFIKFGDKILMPNGKRVIDFSLEELKAGERVLAKQIRLSVTGPEHICIIGKNGTGKTTLLRKIAEELLARKDIHAFYMPQNYEELLESNQTPVEFLADIGDKEETGRIRTYLGSMKFTADEMSHTVGALSGGQKAKLFLLKISMRGADVLILDEPTRNFSPLSGPVIRNMLKNYKGAIISVSHDRKYIKEVCPTRYELTEEGLKRAPDEEYGQN